MAAKCDQGDRPRRGRPAGKNRVPLNLEERRARNALYEKERREETAKAMVELAKAVDCDESVVHSDLLATVISFIQSKSAGGQEDVNELQSCNERLMAQIADCERRLAIQEPQQAFKVPTDATTALNKKMKRKKTNTEINDRSSRDKSHKKKKRMAEQYAMEAPQLHTQTVLQPTTAIVHQEPMQQDAYVPAQHIPYALDSPEQQMMEEFNTPPSHGCLSTEEDDAIRSFLPTLEDSPEILPSESSIDMDALNNWSIDEWIENYLM